MKTAGKALFSIVILLFTTFSVFAQNTGDMILGKWKSADNTLTVEVSKQKSKYSAKIIDSKNKQDMGKIIIWNLQFKDADKEWSGGEVQLPDMAHSANCYVTLDDKNTAVITGYHGIRFFGSSKKYLRISE